MEVAARNLIGIGAMILIAVIVYVFRRGRYVLGMGLLAAVTVVAWWTQGWVVPVAVLAGAVMARAARRARSSPSARE